ncbi:MAG: DUF3775 domain-containing protein [Gemmataceae bacterium]|nr:DUF3775 domain-containing protein [Gemmataceae bacterium]
MKLSEIVREVITLAKAANQARLTSGPDDDSPLVTSGSYTSMTASLTAEELRLRAFLQTLPASVIFMLNALMHLGRGDFGPKELLDHYMDIGEIYFGIPELAAADMFEAMPLAEMLEEALEELASAGMDVDALPLNEISDHGATLPRTL